MPLLRRRRELGDSLGTFTDGVLGKFTRKHQTHRRLDFSRTQSGLLVVSGELSGFSSDTFEDIVDERVHDRHTLLRDTSIGVHLLQHFVNVRRVGFHALLALSFGGSGLLRWGCFRRLLGWSLGHG